MERRSVDYRTVLRVAELKDTWAPQLDRLTREWLDTKGIHTDPGADHVFRSPALDVTIDHLQQADSAAYRLRLDERRDDETWSTELLAIVAPEDGDSWLSVAVSHSDGKFVARPRLIQMILENLDVTDGSHKIADETRVVDVSQVQELQAVLLDGERRTPVFLHVPTRQTRAAKDDTVRWMRARTTQLAGLGRSFVLTPDASRQLQVHLGPFLDVEPGTIRSFAPGVVPWGQSDAKRHRVMGAAFLEENGEPRVRKLIGSIARDSACRRAEPEDVLRVRRAFERKGITEIFARARPGATQRKRSNAAPSPVSVDPERRERAAGPEGTTATDLPDSREIDRLLAHFDVATLEEALMAAQLASEAADEAESGQLAQHQEVHDLQDQLRAFEEAADDLQLDLAAANRRAGVAEEQALEAWRQAARAQAGPDADLAPAPSRPIAPEKFADIGAAITEQLGEWVVFTGDLSETEELDDRDTLGNGIDNCWRGLQALADYARAIRKGDFVGGNFTSYLQQTPPGYAVFEPGKLAGTESQTTKNSTKLKKQRIFPVPIAVHEDGEVHMWSHLRLTKIGIASPRLHFYDDTAKTGKVYVGYIGTHLDLASTN